MYSQNVYQNQRVLRRSIYIQSVLISREECNAFEDILFFKKLFLPLERFLSTSMPFCSSTNIEDSPKLPYMLNSQRICGPFVLKTIIINHFAFEVLFVLCHSLIRSLYFIQVYIFIPLMHSAPFLRFSRILLTPIFSYVYHHAEYFS